MTEFQALEQAISIAENYVEKSKVDPSEEILKISNEIEKTFDIEQKRLDRIIDILSKSRLKNSQKDIKLSEADRFLLQGLLLKANVRQTAKFKEIADFENDKIDFEKLLKNLQSKLKRLQKEETK